MKILQRLALPIVVLAVFAVGCDTVEDMDPPVETDPDPASVYVANQGNFSDGNGTVTLYNAETEAVEQNAVSDLSTIIQSISLFGDELFIMSNTAGRVDVFDTNTLEQTAQITDIEGPRYAAHVSAEKAYVTRTGDFAGETGYVAILDLQNDEVADSIDVGGNPEGIAITGNRAFVATGAFGVSSNVVIIDIASDELHQTVDVNCETPRGVHAVADAYAVVVCTGNEDASGALRVLDQEGAIVDQIDVDQRFTSSTSGSVAFFSAEAEELYAIQADNSVLRVSVSSDGMVGSPETIGPIDGATPGTVAYDNVSEQLYLGRPDQDNPFTASGIVTIHDRQGDELSTFNVGIAPAHIVLDENE